MQVAFHLRRRLPSAPATALLLLSHQPADLVRLLAQIGSDPLPPVFPVADGFLLKLSTPQTWETLAGASGSENQPCGGVLRLRALADHLFLPVDADLIPALLADEAADLVRRRGLVFLPGGRALEFNPTQPVVLSSVLSIGTLHRNLWQPLAEPGPLADRLTEISLELPDILPDDLLAPGGEGIGIEGPLPEDAGLPAKALGGATFGAGKTLAWLGKVFGLKGLAAAGMKMMDAGLNMAPGLSASVLGKQEASLRDLLRAFQRGDVERALRRALPLGGDLPRGATANTGSRLPFHNLLYSLRNILGGSAGSGGLWITEPDLYRELDTEYRKQAELATRRGDYRRAAFIYGKLLRDYRAAAAVLSQGGLHRDAATLYLKPLGDSLAAAREFEAAGEIDRALRLYRQLGDHLLAGDLLRRAGEEEQALAEYVLAADKLATFGQDHYQGGELMRTRAGREDLALPYYQAGWAKRPAGSALPCALRLAQAYTHVGGSDKLLPLAKEAAEYLKPSGNDKPATEFYNELARLADQFPQPEVQDELRDLALVGITGKLRQRAAAGAATVELTSTMIGEGQAWAPAMVSDAQFALRETMKRRPLPGAPNLISRTVIQARVALVTAVCQASTSGDIFLGFSSGEVFCYRPLLGEIVCVLDERRPILSLAATREGDALVVLSEQDIEVNLTSLVKATTFSVRTIQSLSNGCWLCPELAGDAKEFVVGVQCNAAMRFFQGAALLPLQQWPLNYDACLLLPSPTKISNGVAFLAFLDGRMFCNDSSHHPLTASGSKNSWRPTIPQGGSLRWPVLSWLYQSWLPEGRGHIEVAGIGPEGVLCISEVPFSDGKLSDATASYYQPGPPPFLAAAIVRPGYFAGVTQKAVFWLQRRTNGFHIHAKTEVAFSWPVACFRYSRGKEVIVVCSDGTLVRVPEVKG